jgi:hypothetical protein
LFSFHRDRRFSLNTGLHSNLRGTYTSREGWWTLTSERIEEANGVPFQDSIDSSRDHWKDFLSKALFALKQDAIKPVGESIK